MTIRSGAAMGSPATGISNNTTYALKTADVDGVKQSFVVTSADRVLEGADLDGANVTDGALNETFNITITLSNTADGFDPATSITVIGGKYGGGTQRETFDLPAGGNVTLTGVKPFIAGVPLQVVFPSQAGAGTPDTATVEIGTGVGRAIEPPARWVHCNAAGDIYAKLWHADTIAKFTVTVGAQPLAIEMLHAGNAITDLVGIV